MWLKDGRVMGPSALVGVIALIAIEYVANGGQLTAMPPDPSFHARLEYGDDPTRTQDIDARGAVSCGGAPSRRLQSSALRSLQREIDSSTLFASTRFGGWVDRSAPRDGPRQTITITRNGRIRSATHYLSPSDGDSPFMRAWIAVQDAADCPLPWRQGAFSKPDRAAREPALTTPGRG